MLNQIRAFATVARWAMIFIPQRSPRRPQIGPQRAETSGLQLRSNPLQNATPALDVMPSSRTKEGRKGMTSVYPKKISAAEIVMANWFLRHCVIDGEEPAAGQGWTLHPESCHRRSFEELRPVLPFRRR